MPFPGAWIPAPEGGGQNDDVFFQESLFKSIETGNVNKVPIMIGFNKDDGLISSAFLKYKPEKFARIK